MAKKTFTLHDYNGQYGKRWYILEKSEGERCKKHYVPKGGNVVEMSRNAKNLMATLLESDETAIVARPKKNQTLVNWLENHRVNLRTSTYKTFRSKINITEQWLKDNGLRKFTPESAAEFIKYLKYDRGVHATTIISYFNTFRLLYNHAKVVNPFAELVRPKSRHTPYMFYTLEQIKEVGKAITRRDENLLRFVQFIFYTGIRPGELTQLRVSDLSLERRRITVRGEVSKNKKTEMVVIPDALIPIIKEMELEKFPHTHFIFSVYGHPHLKRAKPDYFSAIHHDILIGLGYDTSKHKLYSWKHTGAVVFILNGGNIKALQKQMRHATLEMTDRYLSALGINDFEKALYNFPQMAI